MDRLFYSLLAFSLSLSTTILTAQTVTVRVPGCEETVFRYRFNGVSFIKVEPLAGTEGTYTLPNRGTGISLTYVGTDSGNPIPLLLDGKESFTLTGNCKALSAAVITGSDVNDSYQTFKREMSAEKDASNKLTQQLRLAPAGSPAYEKAKTELGAQDQKRAARLDQLLAGKQDFLAAAWAADLYTSFENSQKPYNSELDYFANERFQYADFSMPAFAENPWVFESFREVTDVLVKSGLAAEAIEEYLKGYLALAVNYPATHKLALGGVIATLRAGSNPIAVPFAKEYIARYGAEEIEAANVLQGEVKRLGGLANGGVAPDFKQERIDSSGEAGPADFRGKILLIDFWASWCGPCRRENPSVVAMYDEYKAQGFEILGVSLDQNRDAWVKAVAADKLTWMHVSDLRGWSNAAAAQYGVRSIPATVLLDREGKIVARNLRGEALRQKVAELVAM